MPAVVRGTRLPKGRARTRTRTVDAPGVPMAEQVSVHAPGVHLGGDLDVPPDGLGVVVFAHGSGSSRHSPRNRHVAAALGRARLATLLLDLLTADEERRDAVDGSLRFDVRLLAQRLTAAVDDVAQRAATHALPVGLFGASTGAAAALLSAVERPDVVRAVVSRGGRPDLAADALARVVAPTLLLVGARDTEVLGLNERAAAAMTCVREVRVVSGATHLFEEPGAMDEVSRQAAAWFTGHLSTT